MSPTSKADIFAKQLTNLPKHGRIGKLFVSKAISIRTRSGHLSGTIGTMISTFLLSLSKMKVCICTYYVVYNLYVPLTHCHSQRGKESHHDVCVSANHANSFSIVSPSDERYDPSRQWWYRTRTEEFLLFI